MAGVIKGKIPLFSRWPTEALVKRKGELGERAFGRGFQQRAYAPGELTFPSWDAAKAKGANQEVRDLWRGEGPVMFGVDLSSNSRPGTVIYVLHVKANGARLPLAIERGKWTSPGTAAKINELAIAYRPDIIMVENNGYQQALIDWCRAANYSWWTRVKSFTTGSNKVSPEMGLPSLEVEMANEAWIVPRGEWMGHPADCECGWCAWDREMSEHPARTETDTVMAMWFAREAGKHAGGGAVRSEHFSLQMGR